MIIPSIDIMDGKAVQLRQGRDLILTDPRHPAALAAEFGRYGPVAVVDLDAALGRGQNRELVTACCRAARCRVGGGIRTHQDVRDWIRRGADKVVIGTMAEPEFLRVLPREWIIAALDARGDEVVTQGWTAATGRTVLEQARRLEPHCSEFLYTQVDREGMLEGCALENAMALRSTIGIPITVAGGISSTREVCQVVEAGFNAQLGRALYEGRIDLAEAWVSALRFDPAGLVPTIVQERRSRDVLMLAYSNTESLHRALTRGEGWYYSRSRQTLWRKGETSGHVQKLVSASWDCDRDTVRFLVDQTGPTCHLGRSTCFDDGGYDVLGQLERLITLRRDGAPVGSYTQQLLNEPERISAKLREEIEEVITATNAFEVAWECADVLYHLMVRMAAAGVDFDAVLRELRSRFKPDSPMKESGPKCGD